jgi:hypothetical protein
VPKWLRRAFDLRGPVDVVASEPGDLGGRRVHRRQHVTLPLSGAICVPCNNERLSPLERAAAPILRPMVLEASPTVLDLAARSVIAAWAFKTALLLEFAIREHYASHRLVQGYESSDAELAWLWARGEPSPRARVWLGTFEAQHRINLRFGACLVSAWGRDATELSAHLTTFTCGYVAFQVFSIDFVRAESSQVLPFPDPPPELDRFLHPIWPAGFLGELAWPQKPFGVGRWDEICAWPRSVPQPVNVLRQP